MNQSELMNKIDEVLAEAKAGLLATVDVAGRAHMRWMTPAVLKGRAGALYCVTRRMSPKTLDLQVHPEGEWMIQSKSLNEIINVRGVINVLDNPALKTEVMETLGERLTVFWKVDMEKIDFVVLETIIKEATYLRPMKGKSETVKFG